MTANWCRSRCSITRHAARRLGAVPALRLRRLWHHHSRRLQHQLPVAGRPRLRLCHRPCPRRQGQGLCLVRGRQAGQEDQHLHAISSPPPTIWSRRSYTSHDRIVAQGGSAGGMLMGAVANMAPEAIRRHHRRGALRRRADHHARRHAAAHPAGMAGMGQPDRRRRRTTRRSPPTRPTTMSARKAYPPILALGRPDRPARHLLGAGEMGGAAARRKTDDNPVCSRPTWMPAMAARRAASSGWRRSPMLRLRAEGRGQDG